MPSISQSAYHPFLYTSEALEVSEEQKMWIRRLLNIISSDVQFAEKAYNGLVAILTSGSVVPAEITSIVPASAALGSSSFTISVVGTGFTPESVILWNGAPEPTTFVSETELTTGVNMSTAVVAIDIPVSVQNADGSISNAMTFSLTPAEGDSSGDAFSFTTRKK